MIPSSRISSLLIVHSFHILTWSLFNHIYQKLFVITLPLYYCLHEKSLFPFAFLWIGLLWLKQLDEWCLTSSDYKINSKNSYLFEKVSWCNWRTTCCLSFIESRRLYAFIFFIGNCRCSASCDPASLISFLSRSSPSRLRELEAFLYQRERIHIEKESIIRAIWIFLGEGQAFWIWCNSLGIVILLRYIVMT